jgi:hypothetical protein
LPSANLSVCWVVIRTRSLVRASAKGKCLYSFQKLNIVVEVSAADYLLFNLSLL